MNLKVRSIEVLMQGGVAVLPGQKLTVMVGDTVRVHLGVDYRGPAIEGWVHVTYGRQNAWFNEDGNKQSDTPVSFGPSVVFTSHEIACDVYIGGSSGTNYDLYAKIMEVPGPDIFSSVLLDVLDVIGVAEFRNFEITGYDKA